MSKYHVTAQDIQEGCARIAAMSVGTSIVQRAMRLRVFGVPRGGVPVAMMVAAMANGEVVDTVEQADILVDDIYDSGATFSQYEKYGLPFYVLFDKRRPQWQGKWLVMPWEGTADDDHSTDDIGIRLLQAIGENPARGGLAETPKRFIGYMREATSGYNHDPAALLKTFDDGAENVDEMVVVAGIPFYSMCEHHMAPFFGQAHIAYIPGQTPTGLDGLQAGNTRIVGLSKLPRLLDVFAKRLQVQERITNQVADVLHKELGALGAGVVLRARHLCMEMRGVKKAGSITYTSAVRGALKDKPEARSEFLRFVEMADSRMGSL